MKNYVRSATDSEPFEPCGIEIDACLIEISVLKHCLNLNIDAFRLFKVLQNEI